MGIFDIDSGADNHLLNEQFHVFSKSPASVATALGDASNRSGHTVTASDVWGQEIPAFFYAKTQAVADSYKSLAKTNDLCRIGNSVAIFENGNWVVKYNSYTDIPDGHKFKNANGDEVIRFHKNRLAYNLNLDNNAADDGLNTTAKIQGWDEENSKVYDYVATAPKFVTQFVTSTDKIVDGIPSKGFGPFVMAGTTTGDITKVLPEGTSDSNHYIANSFAGIIQFNKARTDAIYVHAFEYCGKTLKSAYSDIVELDEKLSKISVTASGGVQDASTDAKAAGLSVTTEKRTDADGKEETIPVLDIETGTVATGVTKLVTGDAVKTYVDTTALAEGGSIAKAIADYVATNAKVSVNGQSATTITVAGTAAGAADLVKVVVTEDKTTTDKIGLTLTATLDAAVLNEDGSIDKDGVVIATIAQDIAESVADTAITNAITGTDGAIKDAIDTAISDATLNSGTQGDNQIQTSTGDAANKLVTAAQVKEYVTENAQVTVTVGSSKKTSTGFEFAGSTGTDIAVAPTMDANGKVTYAATLSKATVDSSTGAITNGSLAVSASDAKTIVDKAIVAAVADGSTIDTRIDEVITTAVADGGTIDNRIDTLISNATSTSAIVDNDTSNKLVTASQVATYVASEVGAITIPSVTTTAAAQTVGVTASGHAVDVATADYTKATYDGTGKVTTEGSWTDASKNYLVTGDVVRDFVGDETAKTLDAAKAYSNSLHTTSVTYHVTETLPTVPAGKEEEYKGRIYLVTTGKDGVVAADGSRIEYMYVNEGTEEAPSWDWEQIGTTTADLSGYAKSVKINSTTYSATAANAGALDLGTVVNKVMVGGGDVPQGGEGANVNSLMGHITEGALYLGIASATDSVMGVSKMFSGDLGTAASDVTDTAVSVKSAQAMYSTLATLANSKVSSVSEGWYLNLAGLAVSTSGTDVTIEPTSISQFDPSIIGVKGNIAKGVNGANINIDTDKIYSPNESEQQITMLSGKTNLQYWIADIPNVVNGSKMFEGCTQLATFCGDLSSLTNGYHMFYSDTALTSFCGDLSGLTGGGGMFSYCKLDAESLECIADTINDVRSLTTSTQVTKLINISYNCSAADAQAAQTAIQAKGWTCTMEYKA